MRSWAVVVASLCLVTLAFAAPAKVDTASSPDTTEWVFAEIVDDLKSHTAPHELESNANAEALPPSMVETEAAVQAQVAAEAEAEAAAMMYGAPPMYYRPGFYPPVAPGYYGYFGYQPTYTHPYLSQMPRYMAVAEGAEPAAAPAAPASPPASALAAYTQYGFPYSSFPPIPPPMPTYLPPPPYIPPDGLNAEGLSGGAAAGGAAAPAAPPA